MGNLDYLIALVKKPQDEGFRKKGKIIAFSFECGISSHGDSPEEAAKSLAALLNGHLKDCAREKVSPFHTNIEGFEDFGKYCAEKKRLPKRISEDYVGYGLTLVSYDLTDA